MALTFPKLPPTASPSSLFGLTASALSSVRSTLVFLHPDGEEFKVVFDVLSCYDVVCPIGYGTFGYVCSAYDKERVKKFEVAPPEEYVNAESAEEREAAYSSATHVAIKKLTTLFENNQPRMWLCASREIQLMMAFNHINVLSAIDFFIPLGRVDKLSYESMYHLRTTFDSVYVVMDKMDYSLREVLDSAFITAAEASPEYMEMLSSALDQNSTPVNSTTNSPRSGNSPVLNDAIVAESSEREIDMFMKKILEASEVSGVDQGCEKISQLLSGHFNWTILKNTLVGSDIRKASRSVRRALNKLCGSPNQRITKSSPSNLTGDGNGMQSCTTPLNSSNLTRCQCSGWEDGSSAKGGIDDVSKTLTLEKETQQQTGGKTTDTVSKAVPRTPPSLSRNLCCPGTGLTLHPLSKDYRKFILYQIFRGVGYLHHSMVMHRDLKPENILLNYNYTTCITDFGQGRDVSGNKTDRASTMLGNCSQWYAAPDSVTLSLDTVRAGFVDSEFFHAMDVWSIGCIAAEMLIGRPLFYNPSVSTVGHLVAIVEILGEIPRDALRAILDRRHSLERETFVYVIEIIHALLKAPRSHLKQLLKSPFGDETEDEIQLIMNCLVWNPQERITIQKALESPYFVDDGYEPVIDPKGTAKQVPVVHPEEISDPVSGRAFLWDLFTKRHPEVAELCQALEKQHAERMAHETQEGGK